MTRGIVIAATHSGAGKTTITLSLMRALSRQFQVVPFKIGPDYIDPSFHRVASKKESHNLDLYLLGEHNLKKIYYQAIQTGDIALVEGVMGLFDGMGTQSWGSSAHVAKILELPVILIIDVQSMSTSAAALVHGFQTYDPEVQLTGVICNRTSSHKHYALIKESVERDCGLPVIGHLPFKDSLVLPERHLGLIPSYEIGDLDQWLDDCADLLLQNIQIGQLLELMKTEENQQQSFNLSSSPSLETIRIGIAFDEAFHFYYSDSLEAFRSCGAELVYFSPIHDQSLPKEIDGLILGGGFPEIFAQKLSQNESMRKSIRTAIEKGLPTYAECGGLMYLLQDIEDFNNQRVPMVGVFPAQAVMNKRLQNFGYVEVHITQDNIIAPAGHILHGHEFHYSKLVGPQLNTSYRVKKPTGNKIWKSGLIYKNCLASYVHVHFLAYPECIQNLLNYCHQWKLENG